MGPFFLSGSYGLGVYKEFMCSNYSVPRAVDNTWVLFGSKNVTQMVMVMVSARLLAVTNLNRLVSNFSVVSDYGWTKTNMI
jgi:hypothetical protein